MRLFGRKFEGLQRPLVIFILLLLVASGLCGMQWALANRDRGMNAFLPVFMITGILELCVMAACLMGIAGVLLVWLTSALWSRFNAPVEGPSQGDPQPPWSENKEQSTDKKE